MRCLQSFGERNAGRGLDHQIAEIHVRIALMYRFNVLTSSEIICVA